MTDPNLSASAETVGSCEIPAPAISQSDAVVQRARQALNGWPGQPITDDDRRVNAIIGSITVAQHDLVTDLLGLVEVALPTVTAQRDEWKAKWRDAVNHADVIAAEDAELRTTIEELEVDRDTGYRNRMAEHELRSQRDKARDERDRLRATVERIRAALGNHPRCDVHPDDLITCGWKRAVHDVQAALDWEA